MERRLELLLYALAACVQVFVAWIVYSHHFPHQPPPSPAAAAHIAAPPAAGGGGSQSSKRIF
jgi:hypothetical protein